MDDTRSWGQIGRDIFKGWAYGNAPIGPQLFRMEQEQEQAALQQQRAQRLEQIADRKAGIDAVQGFTNIAKAQVSPAVKKVLIKNYLGHISQLTGRPVDESVQDAIMKATDDDRQMMIDGLSAFMGSDETAGALKLMDTMGDLPSAMGVIQKGLEIKGKREERDIEQRWLGASERGEMPPQPPTPQRSSSMVGPTQYRAEVEREARAAGLDPRLVESMIRVESGGNPRAVSPAGAQGLMQIMPETGRGVGLPPEQAFDPKQNIKAGVTYFKQLYDQYGGDIPKALTAYHSGPGNVDAGTLGPKGRAYAPQVMGVYRGLGGPDLSQTNAKLGAIDQQIGVLMKAPNTPGIQKRLNDLQQERQSLMQQRQFAVTESRQERGEQRQDIAESRMQRGEARQESAEARAQFEAGPEGEARKIRIAQAGREVQPVGKEITDKTDALLSTRQSIDTIQDILERRGADPTFFGDMKAQAKSWTGPAQALWRKYFGQTFVPTEDPDENDFVTAIRNLQSTEIRASAGLAQTGTEVDRAIGFFGGRLPLESNPAPVFKSRMQFLDDAIDRQLEGMATNLEGRKYGQWVKEQIRGTPRRQQKQADEDLLLKEIGK